MTLIYNKKNSTSLKIIIKIIISKSHFFFAILLLILLRNRLYFYLIAFLNLINLMLGLVLGKIKLRKKKFAIILVRLILQKKLIRF